ncbi:SDR family oxidoreductase [Paenibacillus sacheonensis]|uniref:SDR family NAD(P)-dependent oxidoreductase n=1 Tax=Paenibacillus sacheonensis TaxID=742054 RepID=A0A7X4YRA5_9BACL|nr:SDR family oxidoreductase [Paenibacillus sacheonensis]MBM7565108.1 NAD(P)-dependent dehydrogenase (short-subunit alcohol dehydrogenase family) [Paenibacillus sacheonensis]NBC70109.1 SDR family NAD(P)-dependent oxidoreductase [Paenibacillus sacheonensis]
MSKVIAITGASSGIGLASALKLAENGWTVYAGTRQVERERELYGDKANLLFIEMEVTDPSSLEAAFKEIESAHGRLDVLFCNAGFGYLRSLGQADPADIARVFDTNVYGVMHAIRAALPLLRQADPGYIIATTSVGGLVGQPFNEIYCASKFAVEGLIESLATYYKPTFNIDLTLLEPGAVATNFNGTVFDQIRQTGGILDDEYKPMLTRYTETFQARNSVPQTPEAVADVVLELLGMETKPLRIRTSEMAEAFCRFKVEQDPTGLDGLLNTRKLHLRL